MKLKILIALLLSISLCILLCGCSKDSNEDKTPESDEVNGTPNDNETVPENNVDNPDNKDETEKGDESDKESPEKEEGAVLNYDGMKAMWLSQFDLTDIYRDGEKQRERDDFERRIYEVLYNVKSLGINTVIVQVRPNGDSMYPSEIYPMSHYVVGDYGKDAVYDPFLIILNKAHEMKLSVHAWINPMRCMSESDIVKIPEKYLLRKLYDGKETNGTRTVTVKSNVYLNPAYPEVRKLIADGAAEIVRKYPVDGIHMDDYFYPTTDESFDSTAYLNYKSGGGTLSLADFRRNNVNKMVKEIYSAVKSENPNVPFGISPAGNMKNNYNTLYADVETWCGNEGYIDYICPQVYFGFEHATVPYAKVCDEFAKMIKCDKIRLIIGISIGKAITTEDKWAGAGKDEWKENKDVLKRQLQYALDMPKCSGICYFCYQYFYSPKTGQADTRASEEKANLIPLLKECEF